MDSKILHELVHGDDETNVPTEGGDVKTVAKTIKEIEEHIQSELDDLGATTDQIAQTLDQAQAYRDEAKSSVQSAIDAAHALHLPSDIRGQAGKLLAINQNEDGFEVIESVGVFYGLRVDGSELTAITGQGRYDANHFSTWFITLPGVDFTINEDGHLIINI
ncbi:hypothetical protein [Bartonella rattaustraliani]|uniref:hypothetical protein n=1 Tax=Bartonella rattaustraliani TaxID=481139 RepID=UPI000376FDD7|nr:hypothetical protein [Bartonella rattaustraliani]